MLARQGMTIFACPYNETAIDEAREYIKAMEFTSEDVKIIRKGEMILVEAIRDV